MIKNLFSLKGKIAIVTGANGLIGKEHCKALESAGAKVVLCDIKDFQMDFMKDPNLHMKLIFDITKKNQIINANKKILKKFNKIDILVNNAAINDMFENPEHSANLSMFENYPLDSWVSSLNVNLTGLMLCCQIFGRDMIKRKKGSIINVASTYGLLGPDQSIYKDENEKQVFFKGPSYPTTKGGVINFTRYLASYWGKYGVRVNSLSPGGVKNNQSKIFINKYSSKTVLGRMADKKDYWGAIIFLSCDASSYMTGSNLVVDGGWTSI